MRSVKIICFIVILLLITGCESNEINEKNISEEIKAVLFDQQEAWNNGDIDSYMKGYWNSEELSFASNGTVTKGWNFVSERYKLRYDTREKMGRLIFSDLKVSVLSEESAFILGTWLVERETDNLTGKFTVIFRKFPEGWRVVHDHTSSLQTN